MTVKIPPQYERLVAQAAADLGIPVAIVAEQINYESGFNPNAVSKAGAQGIAQFIPGTWKSYGHGSPFNPPDAFAAYTAYMKSLLNDFHGDLRKALAAYNAGPGNIGAGMGYANHILGAAGTGDITATPGGAAAAGAGAAGGGFGPIDAGPSAAANFGGIQSVFNAITHFIGSGGRGVEIGGPGDVETIVGGNLPDGLKAAISAVGGVVGWLDNLVNGLVSLINGLLWLLNPANWIRILAFILGTASFIAGGIMVARSS